MTEDEKPLGADAAAVVTAGSIDAPKRQAATPGPWVVEYESDGGYDTLSSAYVVRAAPSRQHITDVDCRNYDDAIEPDVFSTVGTSATAEANANLIAAAPELLDALKLATDIAESWIHDQLDGTRSLDGALAHLKPCHAAIAKAEGR